MSNSRARCLLLVHGRDFKPARDVWFELSLQALRAGIVRDYPDCMATFDAMSKAEAWYGDLTADVLTAAGETYDEPLDVGDRKSVLAALSEHTSRKRFGIRHYDSLPGKSAVPEFVAGIASSIGSATGLTRPLIARASKDFACYLRNDTPYAKNVRERLRSRLCELHQNGCDILLLSHGTGSVVAYDVLWQLSHEPEYKQQCDGAKVGMWVTLGSPLGIKGVRKSLKGAVENAEQRFPANVITWHNVAAEDDYTCCDNTLADDFRKMMHQRLVSAVNDHKIYNLAVRYGRSNPHSSLGYYIHPRTAKIIRDWLLLG